jgi:hypothetical protein
MRAVFRDLPAVLALALVFFCAPTFPASAQGEQAPPQHQQPQMSQGELDALMAPIALYPDPLLSKVLIAATFPDQVHEAAAWLKAHSGLKDTALANAVAQKHWDESVKALAEVPGVLEMMDDQRDWTYELGGAFINQQADVMASIQRLRRQAENHGSLKTSVHQRVVHDGDALAIQPADPQTIYAPYYEPAAVYGAWAYPDYPAYYWPYPYGYGYPVATALTVGLVWGAGVAISAAIWSNAFNWHTHNVWYGGRWYGNGAWNRGYYNNWHYRNYHNTNWHNRNWYRNRGYAGRYHGRYYGHYSGRYHGHYYGHYNERRYNNHGHVTGSVHAGSQHYSGNFNRAAPHGGGSVHHGGGGHPGAGGHGKPGH